MIDVLSFIVLTIIIWYFYFTFISKLFMSRFFLRFNVICGPNVVQHCQVLCWGSRAISRGYNWERAEAASTKLTSWLWVLEDQGCAHLWTEAFIFCGFVVPVNYPPLDLESWGGFVTSLSWFNPRSNSTLLTNIWACLIQGLTRYR